MVGRGKLPLMNLLPLRLLGQVANDLRRGKFFNGTCVRMYIESSLAGQLDPCHRQLEHQ